MYYTSQEVMEYVKSEDIKFIRLSFCDIFGKQKNISIMPEQLPRAFDTGISFDASAIRGFANEERSDLFLVPDPATLAVLPWRPSHGRVARMFCDIKYPDSRPFEADGRAILKKAVAAARDMSLMFYFGAEFEFYLFKTDENGNPTGVPFDNAGYMDIAPEDTGENIRREICLTLDEMGMRPESSHHEEGPGQHEIDFRYSDALTAADNAETFKWIVRIIAARNGLSASFDPKPISGCPGSGMHINMSPHAFDESDYTKSFLAGIMAHAAEMTAVLNPVESSYRRLGEYKAPKYVTWSPENRSQLIRIPAGGGEYSRIELRSPDAMANPYLAYALLIYAGLDGIKRGLTPPDATDINLFTASEQVTSKLDPLPESLDQAKAVMRQSEFIKSVLPEKIIKVYTD